MFLLPIYMASSYLSQKYLWWTVIRSGFEQVHLLYKHNWTLVQEKQWNSKMIESNSNKTLKYYCLGEKQIKKLILKYSTHKLHYTHS